MQSVLAAEFAILVHFKSVRIVFLVFVCVIISLLALGADQSNFDSCVISHFGTSHFKFTTAPPVAVQRAAAYLPQERSLSHGAGTQA